MSPSVTVTLCILSKCVSGLNGWQSNVLPCTTASSEVKVSVRHRCKNSYCS